MGEGFTGAEHRLQQRPQRRPVARPIRTDLQWRRSGSQRSGALLSDCHPNRKAPRGGRLGTGRGSSPWHLGLDRVGCLWFTHRLSWAWQVRNGDHVWEKRCSELDLLGCDPGSGYAALRFNMRESELAYGSLLLRDGVLAAPPSSLVVLQPFDSLAPPLCAPARVVPGRTLLEGEGRVGYRASPQLQISPAECWWGLQEVPVPVPPESQSA